MPSSIMTTVSANDIQRISSAEHHDPFEVLGCHPVVANGKPAVAVRAFLPDVAEAFVIRAEGGKHHEKRLERIGDAGFFEAIFENETQAFRYRLKKVYRSGESQIVADPYSFLPTLSDFDLHLLSAGDHHLIFEKLGAHLVGVDGIQGVRFAVWAPNAKGVSVVGDFNGWDSRRHAMRVLGASGVWEIFVPDLAEGDLYKFQIRTKDGRILDKADPYGFSMEHRPRTASRIANIDSFEWGDRDWLEQRRITDHLARPISIYEVHLGSWARVVEEGDRWLTYREFAERLIPYVLERGFTHIELMPVMEFPFDGSWGYQVTGYYAPTSRFGTPQDFMYFIDQCHRHGIGVILDWVPAHFPNDLHALGLFDGTHLYEHADPRKGYHPDWGSHIFNFGRNEVKNFLIGSAIFWLSKYHIDGLRLDAVASMLYLDYSRKEGEWIPNQYGGRENLEAIGFLRHLDIVVHKYHPDVLMIAEESTSWPGVTKDPEHGGLGFDLKWNMGWMHDTLLYFSKDPIHRKHHHRHLTFGLLYAFSERFILPFSHDEVVHGKGSMIGKMPGDEWQKFANLRLLYGLMYAYPGKKLLFMGGEFGQWREWNHDISLDWHILQYGSHKGLLRWIDDLNMLYKNEPPLFEIDFSHSGFEWVDFHDEASSVISFLRKGLAADDQILVICNFTPVPRLGYRVGAPSPGKYVELLNSDSWYYWGSNVGNSGELSTDPVPAHGREHSLNLVLPPLGALFLKRAR
jgi:1,4-alpha-glucan branching enzyme